MIRVAKVETLLLIAALLLVGTQLFAGGAAEDSVGVDGEGDIVTFALAVEPETIDLHADDTTETGEITQAIYDTLVRFNENMEIEPWLAESYEQLDEVTYRFELREGIEFHSGNPFNAEAVAAHFDRMNDPDNPGVTQSYYGFIETEVIDEYTVDITTDSPFGPTLAYLALSFNGIHDAVLAAEDPDAYGANPSGTGPFMFDEWSRGSYIDLAANEEYWAGAPEVEGLRFRIIPESSTRATAVQTGEVDITTALPLEAIDQVRQADGVAVEVEPENRVIDWIVNPEHYALSDLNVRRALTKAINYEEIIDAVLGDQGSALDGYTVPGQVGYIELPYEYAPDEAEQLLSDSGWERNDSGIFEDEDGEELSFEIMTGDKMARELELFEAISSELRDFGMAVDVDLIEGSQIYPEIFRYRDYVEDERYDELDFGVITRDAGARTGEVNVVLDGHYLTDGHRNAGGYDNPEVDEYLEIAVSAAPQEERVEAYHRFQELVHEDLPAIHLWQPSWSIAVSERVEGYGLHPAAVWYYEDISVVD